MTITIDHNFEMYSDGYKTPFLQIPAMTGMKGMTDDRFCSIYSR